MSLPKRMIGCMSAGFRTCNNEGDLGVESSKDVLICPACGGENPSDAIFCNHEHEHKPCLKALGDFKYVLEEFKAERSGIERLADRITEFVGQTYFVILHMVWFTFWIFANSGLVGSVRIFDEYPYSLLGIILGIEAVFITGFLLISQNYQNAYAEKCAKLDYEVNIRTYRKLLELEKRLGLFNKPDSHDNAAHETL